MGQYDFTYEIPANFHNRIFQFLQQKERLDISRAFQRCKYEYEDKGLAYYAGLKGDTWDKRALDFIVEGAKDDINILKTNNKLLKEIIEMALKPNESGYLIRDILYLVSDETESIIPISNDNRLSADITTANMVLNDLVWIGERACSNATYNESTPENNINDYFRDMLCSRGYNETKDQTRHGFSERGIESGEVDLLLTREGKEIAIFEGLRLQGVKKNYIDEHIDKAINNYNALGTATFIVSYVSKMNFGDFWDKYFNHLEQYSYDMEVKKPIKALPYPNASTRVAMTILSRDGYDFPVYFVAFKIC